MNRPLILFPGIARPGPVRGPMLSALARKGGGPRFEVEKLQLPKHFPDL